MELAPETICLALKYTSPSPTPFSEEKALYFSGNFNDQALANKNVRTDRVCLERRGIEGGCCRRIFTVTASGPESGRVALWCGLVLVTPSTGPEDFRKGSMFSPWNTWLHVYLSILWKLSLALSTKAFERWKQVHVRTFSSQVRKGVSPVLCYFFPFWLFV